MTQTDSPQPHEPSDATDEQAPQEEPGRQEDPRLLQRLLDEGEQVLAEAFAVNRERFWHLVTFRMDRRIAARVDADDVLQEAFVAACNRLDHYLKDPSFTLFVWLRMIVAQTLIDVHRRHFGAEMRSAGREVSMGGPRYPQTTSVSLAAHLVGNQTSPAWRLNATRPATR